MTQISPKTASQLVAEARQQIENLPPERVATEAGSGDALLVDIREPDERLQNGFIAGSVSAPRGMLEFWADPTSPYHREEFQPGRRIVLYCASSGRSALASATLGQLGYTNVAHLDGGFKAWKEAGLPVEKPQ
ncbi:MAG TPA: rhodanese-like domain-containing protein [Dehalococcoidia bacterium]|nr:rhodanese-like domain-containing protein [Dehalococcoidia bacterium]